MESIIENLGALERRFDITISIEQLQGEPPPASGSQSSFGSSSQTYPGGHWIPANPPQK